MKIIKNILVLPILVSGLCVPATAQIKKALTALGKETKNMQTVGKMNLKRFRFPSNAAQLNQTLQQSLAAATQRATLQTPALPPLPQHPYMVFAQSAAEKEFLAINNQEHQFYGPEYTAANGLLRQAHYFEMLPGKLTAQDRATLQDGLTFIQNNFLHELLENTLADGNLTQFQLELADYYTLSKPFVEAAFSYTVRHPHKRTLHLRRLMVNPFIDAKFKQPVTYFLAAPKIHPLEYETFKEALANLYQEYKRIEQQSLQAPGIQAQQAFYDNLIDRVETFVAVEGRLPKWNTRSSAEKELYNQVDFALNNAPDFSIPALVASKNQLHMVMAKYASKPRSRQETLQAFAEFVKTTGLLYPRALTESNTVLEGEESLFDDLMYWRMVDENAVARKIKDIQWFYSSPSPKESFYNW